MTVNREIWKVPRTIRVVGEKKERYKMSDQVNFTNIGQGYIHIAKSGSKSIRLRLDPGIREAMTDDDFANKIFIFRTEKLDKDNNPTYSVSAPVKSDYEKDSKLV